MFTTPQQVIDRARILGYISSGQFNDTIALQEFNIQYLALANLITQDVDEDFFSEIITSTAVVAQNEYTLKDDTNNIDVNKIGTVDIAYKAIDNYVRATRVYRTTLPSVAEQMNYQTSAPVFYILDDSVFIYPAPTVEVAKGIRLGASLTPSPLLIGGTITSSFPQEWRHLIADGMLPVIYQKRGLTNEKNDAKRDYAS
jgi:hypothetical protein